MNKLISSSMLMMAATFVLTSCGPSLKVSTDYDKSANFSNYKTYAFYKLSTKGESVSELNRNRIISAIKSEMGKKGFTEVGSNADVLVNATTILKANQTVTANTNYYGYGGMYRPYGWGPSYMGGTTTYSTYNYKDGSLIIDVVDAAKQQLVWQGTGNKEIDKPSGDPDAKIKEAVTKIMEGFPPGKAK